MCESRFWPPFKVTLSSTYVQTMTSHNGFPEIVCKDQKISYGRRYYPELDPGMPGVVSLALEIPDGLTCSQCVLQWRWHGGKLNESSKLLFYIMGKSP